MDIVTTSFAKSCYKSVIKMGIDPDVFSGALLNGEHASALLAILSNGYTHSDSSVRNWSKHQVDILLEVYPELALVCKVQ